MWYFVKQLGKYMIKYCFWHFYKHYIYILFAFYADMTGFIFTANNKINKIQFELNTAWYVNNQNFIQEFVIRQ